MFLVDFFNGRAWINKLKKEAKKSQDKASVPAVQSSTGSGLGINVFLLTS